VIPSNVDSIEELVLKCEENPDDIRFDDLCRICKHYFGEARIKSSHHIYKTPWPGNIQDDNGKAKAYQVRQVIKAIKKLESI